MTKSVISESHGFYMLSFLRNSPSFLAEWLCHFTFPWAMDEWTSFSRQCLMVCVTICDVSHPDQCVWPLRWFCSALPSWRMMLSIFSLCAPCLSFLVKCSSRLPVFWVGCPENYAEKEEPVLKVKFFLLWEDPVKRMNKLLAGRQFLQTNISNRGRVTILKCTVLWH